jgi:hypothetical protein
MAIGCCYGMALVLRTSQVGDAPMTDLMLLKYGLLGILKQGLRIAPPEAPVSGYMFGKGVYFADVRVSVPRSSAVLLTPYQRFLQMMSKVIISDILLVQYTNIL